MYCPFKNINVLNIQKRAYPIVNSPLSPDNHWMPLKKYDLYAYLCKYELHSITMLDTILGIHEHLIETKDEDIDVHHKKNFNNYKHACSTLKSKLEKLKKILPNQREIFKFLVQGSDKDKNRYKKSKIPDTLDAQYEYLGKTEEKVLRVLHKIGSIYDLLNHLIQTELKIGNTESDFETAEKEQVFITQHKEMRRIIQSFELLLHTLRTRFETFAYADSIYYTDNIHEEIDMAILFSLRNEFFGYANSFHDTDKERKNKNNAYSYQDMASLFLYASFLYHENLINSSFDDTLLYQDYLKYANQENSSQQENSQHEVFNYGPIFHEDIYDLEFFSSITTSFSIYIKEIHSFENPKKCKKFLQKLTNNDMLRAHICKTDIQKLQNEKNITILNVIKCFGFSSILYLLKLYEHKKDREKEIKLIIPVDWLNIFHINLPCINKYINALTFCNDNQAFLQICSRDRDNLSFGGGKVYYRHKFLSDDKKINEYISFDHKKEDCIDRLEKINIPLLNAYYSLVLNSINKTFSTHNKSVPPHMCKCPMQENCPYLYCNKNCMYSTDSSVISGFDPYTIFSISVDELVKFFVPNEHDIPKLRKKIINDTIALKNLVGVFIEEKDKKYFEVINLNSQLIEDTQTIEFSSPYFVILIEKINLAYLLSHERKYYCVLKSSLIGLGNNTIMDKNIINTVISLIYTIIKKDKYSDHISITLDEIVKNNFLLAHKIEKMEENRNQVRELLKEIFSETFGLLGTHTTFYDDFELQTIDWEKEIEHSKGKNWRKIELVFTKVKEK